MNSHLGGFIRKERLRRGMNLGQLAAAIGYHNIGKGMRRLKELEDEGRHDDELLDKVTAALGLDPVEVQLLADHDERSWRTTWEAWVDAPVKPQIIRRLVPGIYQVCDASVEWLGSTREAWEAEACRIARKTGSKVCLAWSRRHRTWINERGEVGRRTETHPGDPGTPGMGLNRGGGIVFQSMPGDHAPEPMDSL